jgi:hypothetical protein
MGCCFLQNAESFPSPQSICPSSVSTGPLTEIRTGLIANFLDAANGMNGSRGSSKEPYTYTRPPPQEQYHGQYTQSQSNLRTSSQASFGSFIIGHKSRSSSLSAQRFSSKLSSVSSMEPNLVENLVYGKLSSSPRLAEKDRRLSYSKGVDPWTTEAQKSFEQTEVEFVGQYWGRGENQQLNKRTPFAAASPYVRDSGMSLHVNSTSGEALLLSLSESPNGDNDENPRHFFYTGAKHRVSHKTAEYIQHFPSGFLTQIEGLRVDERIRMSSTSRHNYLVLSPPEVSQAMIPQWHLNHRKTSYSEQDVYVSAPVETEVAKKPEDVFLERGPSLPPPPATQQVVKPDAMEPMFRDPQPFFPAPVVAQQTELTPEAVDTEEPYYREQDISVPVLPDSIPPGEPSLFETLYGNRLALNNTPDRPEQTSQPWTSEPAKPWTSEPARPIYREQEKSAPVPAMAQKAPEQSGFMYNDPASEPAVQPIYWEKENSAPVPAMMQGAPGQSGFMDNGPASEPAVQPIYWQEENSAPVPGMAQEVPQQSGFMYNGPASEPARPIYREEEKSAPVPTMTQEVPQQSGFMDNDAAPEHVQPVYWEEENSAPVPAMAQEAPGQSGFMYNGPASEPARPIYWEEENGAPVPAMTQGAPGQSGFMDNGPASEPAVKPIYWQEEKSAPVPAMTQEVPQQSGFMYNGPASEPVRPVYREEENSAPVPAMTQEVPQQSRFMYNGPASEPAVQPINREEENSAPVPAMTQGAPGQSGFMDNGPASEPIQPIYWEEENSTPVPEMAQGAPGQSGFMYNGPASEPAVQPIDWEEENSAPIPAMTQKAPGQSGFMDNGPASEPAVQPIYWQEENSAPVPVMAQEASRQSGFMYNGPASEPARPIYWEEEKSAPVPAMTQEAAGQSGFMYNSPASEPAPPTNREEENSAPVPAMTQGAPGQSGFMDNGPASEPAVQPIYWEEENSTPVPAMAQEVPQQSGFMYNGPASEPAVLPINREEEKSAPVPAMTQEVPQQSGFMFNGPASEPAVQPINRDEEQSAPVPAMAQKAPGQSGFMYNGPVNDITNEPSAPRNYTAGLESQPPLSFDYVTSLDTEAQQASTPFEQQSTMDPASPQSDTNPRSSFMYTGSSAGILPKVESPPKDYLAALESQPAMSFNYNDAPRGAEEVRAQNESESIQQPPTMETIPSRSDVAPRTSFMYKGTPADSKPKEISTPKNYTAGLESQPPLSFDYSDLPLSGDKKEDQEVPSVPPGPWQTMETIPSQSQTATRASFVYAGPAGLKPKEIAAPRNYTAGLESQPPLSFDYSEPPLAKEEQEKETFEVEGSSDDELFQAPPETTPKTSLVYSGSPHKEKAVQSPRPSNYTETLDNKGPLEFDSSLSRVEEDTASTAITRAESWESEDLVSKPADILEADDGHYKPHFFYTGDAHKDGTLRSPRPTNYTETLAFAGPLKFDDSLFDIQPVSPAVQEMALAPKPAAPAPVTNYLPDDTDDKKTFNPQQPFSDLVESQDMKMRRKFGFMYTGAGHKDETLMIPRPWNYTEILANAKPLEFDPSLSMYQPGIPPPSPTDVASKAESTAALPGPPDTTSPVAPKVEWSEATQLKPPREDRLAAEEMARLESLRSERIALEQAAAVEKASLEQLKEARAAAEKAAEERERREEERLAAIEDRWKALEAEKRKTEKAATAAKLYLERLLSGQQAAEQAIAEKKSAQRESKVVPIAAQTNFDKIENERRAFERAMPGLSFEVNDGFSPEKAQEEFIVARTGALEQAIKDQLEAEKPQAGNYTEGGSFVWSAKDTTPVSGTGAKLQTEVTPATEKTKVTDSRPAFITPVPSANAGPNTSEKQRLMQEKAKAQTLKMQQQRRDNKEKRKTDQEKKLKENEEKPKDALGAIGKKAKSAVLSLGLTLGLPVGKKKKTRD